jgi:hypothetical protein
MINSPAFLLCGINSTYPGFRKEFFSRLISQRHGVVRAFLNEFG